MDKKNSESIAQAERDCQDGIKWWEGYSVEQDFERAAASFERAALAGHVGAMRKLAMISYYAFEDDEKAFYWMQRAAEAGNESESRIALELLERFQAPAPSADDYYFELFLQASSYDHVVYSDLSCEWRNEIGHARNCARQIAKALGLNGNKAEALAILKGRTQLPFGPAGTAYIQELAARSGINFDEQSLCLANVRNSFAQCLNMRFRVTDDLIDAIARLYQEDEAETPEEKQEESRVVVAIYKMLRDYARLRENKAMNEEKWRAKCQATIKASLKAGKLLPFTDIAKLAKRYADVPPVLPDAEREFLDIVWTHYQKLGARGIDLVRRVTASANQGEQVIDFRRVGRKTSDGQRIETYRHKEAPAEYRLKIHTHKKRRDLTYGGVEEYEETKTFPLKLDSTVTADSLKIEILELLCANGTFVGAVICALRPSDVRSLAKNKQQEILLIGQKKHYGYSGGNDEFDLSYGFCVTIEKHTHPDKGRGAAAKSPHK